RKTVWFTDAEETAKQSASPMRFILSQPALRYAWWLFLAGLLLFVIFQAKRKQRIVPVVERPKNKSVEFVKSIGNLYLQECQIIDMMAKKEQYFQYRIRTELLLDNHVLDEHFEEKLSLKTGKSREHIREAVQYLRRCQNPYTQVTA